MDVQQIAALAIVAVAALFLARRLWRQARGKESDECAGCGGACGKPAHSAKNNIVRPAPQATPLVTLGSPAARPLRPGGGSRPKAPDA